MHRMQGELRPKPRSLLPQLEGTYGIKSFIALVKAEKAGNIIIAYQEQIV